MPTPYLIENPGELYNPGMPGLNNYGTNQPLRQRWGPWERSGVLYTIQEREILAIAPNYPNEIRMYRSLNSGQNWSEQDSANRVVVYFYAISAVDRIGDLVYVAWVKLDPTSMFYVLAFKTFSFVTNTWSAVVESPFAVFPGSLRLQVRSTGDVLFIYIRFVGGFPRISYSVYSGGAWPAQNQDIIGGAIGYDIPNVFTGTLDRAHIFYTYTFGGWPGLAHVSLDAAYAASAQTVVLNPNTQGPWTYYRCGLGALWGTQLALPFALRDPGSADYADPPGTRKMAVIVGSQEVNPVFTSSIVSTTPPHVTAPGNLGPKGYSASAAIVSGGVLHVVWQTDYGNGVSQPVAAQTNRIYRNSNDGSGWTADTEIYNSLQLGPNSWPAHNLCAEMLSGGVIGVLFDQVNSSRGYYLRTPTTPPVPVAAQLIGLKSRTLPGSCPKSREDDCLNELAAQWLKIEWCKLRDRDLYCFGLSALGFPDEMPEQSQGFDRRGAILTPAPAAGDVEVFRWQVPFGYDAVVMGWYHAHVGLGFQDGSGDILWRIQVAGRWLKDMGQVNHTMGDWRHEWPVDGTVVLRSGNLLRYLVAVPNVSGMIPVGVSRIVCGVRGFLTPSWR